jgi:LSD1 subclass zinc finger protein
VFGSDACLQVSVSQKWSAQHAKQQPVSCMMHLCELLRCCLLQVPVYGHVGCGGCSIMLMYPLGAQSVKCSVCHYVTHVSQQANWGGSGGAGQQQAAQPKTQTVVVENPPSLDEKGNEVRSNWTGCRWRAGGLAQQLPVCVAVCMQLCAVLRQLTEQLALRNSECFSSCRQCVSVVLRPHDWCCCCVACRWRTLLWQ